MNSDSQNSQEGGSDPKHITVNPALAWRDWGKSAQNHETIQLILKSKCEPGPSVLEVAMLTTVQCRSHPTSSDTK